MTPNREG